jgi:hypothetical protein
MGAAMAEKVVAQQWQWQRSNDNGGTATAMAVQQRLRRRSNDNGGGGAAMAVQDGGGSAVMVVDRSHHRVWYHIELYRALFLSNKLISYVAFYVGPIQTGFLMTLRKSYGRTGIMIPVKKAPQERRKQESGGFLQE